MISIDPITLIISIINFLVIIFALNTFLYKPIRQILLRRKETFNGLDHDINPSIADAEEKDAEAVKAELDVFAESISQKILGSPVS